MPQKLVDHPLQRHIIGILTRNEAVHFSDLLEPDMESNSLTYHLQQLIKDGLVESPERGVYYLSELGKQIGRHSEERSDMLLRRARSILILAVQHAETGEWLLSRRLTQPLLHKVGFMHAEPQPKQTQEETATQTLKEITNLDGSFQYVCSGLQTSTHDGAIENFISFNLLMCNDAHGELRSQDDYYEFFWQTKPDWSDTSMVPSMPHLANTLAHKNPPFLHLFFEV
jgi:hypothetical protein